MNMTWRYPPDVVDATTCFLRVLDLLYVTDLAGGTCTCHRSMYIYTLPLFFLVIGNDGKHFRHDGSSSKHSFMPFTQCV